MPQITINAPIAAYDRFSKDEQATPGAIASHLFVLRRAAQIIDRPLEDDFIFSDIGISGRRNDRPQFEKVIGLAREQKISVLIVRLDRLARNVEMTVTLGKLFERSPVLLFDALKERFIDFSNPEDWEEFHVSGVKSDKESRVISKRIKLRNEFNRSQGLAHAGRMPQGFRRSKDGKYEVVPELREQIERVAAIYLQTRSPVETLRQIEQEGITLNFDSYQGLTRWLASPVLRGHTPHLIDRNQRHRPDASKGTIFNTHIPALDRHTLQRIDRVLAENKRIKGRSRGKIYPIGGLMRCALCGSDCHITGMAKGAGGYVYCVAYRKGLSGTVCGTAIKQGGKSKVGFTVDEIEKVVIQSLQSRAVALADREIQELSREAESSIVAVDPADRAILLKIAELEQKCQEMPEVASHFRSAIVELQLQLKPVQQTEENNLEEQRQLLIEVGSDREYWEELSPSDRKELFQQFVKAIVLNRDTKTIDVQLWV